MNRLLKGRLLKGVICVGLWLGLAIKSDVNGMIDTHKPYVKANPAKMGVNATGIAVVSIDLKEIGVDGNWALQFTNDDGKLASDDARTKVIMPARTVMVKMKLSGGEVKNSKGKTVAYAGLRFNNAILYKETANGDIYKFEAGVEKELLWILYKNERRPGDDVFKAGDELPAKWVEGTDGTLTCAMTVSVVAAK